MTDDLDIPPGFYLRDGKPMISWFAALEIHLACDRPIRILGLMCSSHGCTTLATFRTFWPSACGDRYEGGQPKCGRCTTKLEQVATAMGFGLPVQPIAVDRDVEIMLLADYRKAIASEVERLRALNPDDTEQRFAAMELD